MKIIYDDFNELEWVMRRCVITKTEGGCEMCPLAYAVCNEDSHSILCIQSEVIKGENEVKEDE